MIGPAELLAMAGAWCALPDQDRAIFSAVRLDGLDYGEVARRYGCSAADVEATIARVLVAFAIAVEKAKS